MNASRDLFEAQQRIATLERKVADLYTRLGQAEPRWGLPDPGDPADPAMTSAAEDPKVLELIHAGNKIEAIKRYRELTGLGLAEAKDAVDKLG